MQLVKVSGNTLVTNSLTVAQVFGKEHNNVLKDVRKQIGYAGEDFAQVNFHLGTYIDKNNQVRPCYELTEEGFTLLCMSYNTKESVAMKIKFIEEFKRMKEHIQKPNVTEKDQLIATMKLALTHDEEIAIVRDEMAAVQVNVMQIKEKVETLVTLDYGMQRKFQKEIAKSVYRHIVNEEDNEKHRKKLFAEIHREIKDRFAVASYKDVKQKNFSSALTYVQAWIPKKGA